MKSRNRNPWAERFAPLLDRNVIRKRVEVSPEPLKGLMQMNVEVGVRVLQEAFEKLFFPSRQCLDLLEKWVGMAYAHCLVTYPDNKHFLQGINQKEPPLPNFCFPKCLTGLPGSGKTELIKSFQRILPGPSEIEVGSGYLPIPSQSHWSFTINASAAPSDLLNPFSGGTDTLKNLVRTCRKLAFRNGVSFYTVDEFQHATSSATANTRVTQMLLSVGYLGIPSVYGANYSLVYRLMQRPNEDQQRLLADIDVLLPDPPDSEDWILMLKAQKEIAPDIFAFDPEKDGPEIHGLCAGNKRAEKYLLLVGVRIAHKRGIKVTIEIFREAYQSSDYATFRLFVETLLRVTLEPDRTAYSSQQEMNDLRCPIALPKEAMDMMNSQSHKHRKKKVADEKLESSLTPEEKEFHRRQCRLGSKHVGKVPKGAPVKRKTPDSAEDLKHNMNLFKNRILRAR